jgi:hypothetical protein
MELTAAHNCLSALAGDVTVGVVCLLPAHAARLSSINICAMYVS